MFHIKDKGNIKMKSICSMIGLIIFVVSCPFIFKENYYIIISGVTVIGSIVSIFFSIMAIRNAKKTIKLLQPLCSGYGVFPGGEICPGCKDCKGKDKIRTWRK